MPPERNKNGELYPWALEERELNTFEMYKKLQMFGGGPSVVIGKNAQMDHYSTILNDMNNAHSDFEDASTGKTDEELFVDYVRQNKVVGATVFGNNTRILANTRSNSYLGYTNPEETKILQDNYPKMASIVKETGDYFRNLYKDRKDPAGIKYNEKANELADWFDDAIKYYNPKAGNIIEADYHAPYLSMLNGLCGSAPRFDTDGFDKCLDVLEGKGEKGGEPIYDDYMTVLRSGIEETKIQFERQQAEERGWTAEDERKYLNDIRKSHSKTLESYDRLFNIEDRKQYDKALNNSLGHLTGKLPDENRDVNDMMGYMRGEVRAVDMGYDSKHLYVLAQVGMQEQALKKRTAQLETRIKGAKDDETRNALLQEQDELNAYKAEFNEFKNTVWNTRVNTKSEMEKMGEKVDGFFDSHNEKYAKIQNYLEGNKVAVAYNREEAIKAGPMPTPINNELDNKALGDASGTLYVYYGDGDAMGAYLGVTGSQNFKNGKYTPEADKKAKEIAGEFSEKLSTHMAEAEAFAKDHPETADAKMFERNILATEKAYVDNFAKGISMETHSRFRDKSFDVFSSIQAQLGENPFAEDKIAQTQKVVKELGLNEFAEKALAIQAKHQTFELNKDQMTVTERDAFLKDMNADKLDIIYKSGEMYEKLKNASPEVKDFFVKESQLQDFMGARGLSGLIENYSADIMAMDVPQSESLDAALNKFNTARSGIFTSESPQHLSLRESAQKVQENLKILAAGGVKEGRELKALTVEQRDKLIKDTVADVYRLNINADSYIEHAGSPSTTAGKARLEGAKEIKAYAKLIDSVLDKQKVVKEYKAERDKNLKEMEKADEAEVDPLAAEKQKINGWYEKIKSADFNMLGAGSNEYKQIVEKVEELKDYSDVNYFADSKGKVRTDILIEMHEKEAVIADKIQAYLDHKSEQFEKDPKRRDDPGKQKREQPRIKAALDVMADVKTDMAERTNAIVNTMQDKVRAKVEKMLENEGKVRSNPFVTHDEYVKSTYKSLNMINNLDGSNWSLGKNETLGHYVGRIKSYADPKTYDKSKKEIQNDRQNRTRNTLKEANKLFTDSGKRLTNEELKSKYVENTKTIKVYQNDIKKFDLNQAKTQIKEQSKKLKEALVAQPKKQAEKPASLAK